MNYKEALSLLTIGTKMRRIDWVVGRFIYETINDTFPAIVMHNSNLYYTWYASPQDILATD